MEAVVAEAMFLYWLKADADQACPTCIGVHLTSHAMQQLAQNLPANADSTSLTRGTTLEATQVASYLTVDESG